MPGPLARLARRIVSLVPSSTETLASLQLAERVVGRTRYCVHPRPWVDGLPVVGGTKDPDLRALAALHPDLIVANEEENRPEQFPALAAIAPLWVAFPRDVDGALDDLLRMAAALGAGEAGEALASRIAAARLRARAAVAGRRPFRYACLVWRRPWRAAGPDTFASALLAELGGINVVPGGKARYPAVTVEELEAAAPDLVLLPSEPYDFRREHAADLGGLASRARLVDGQLMFWHGARLELAFPYLARLQRP
jgi:ABC-type Fe3+-hydroxamate transport system substrate-binding protein